MNKILSALIMTLITLLIVPIARATNVVSLGQVVYPTVTVSPAPSPSPNMSNVISSAGMSLVGCQLPATFTSTAISFLVATSVNGTYQELDNASGKVSYTVAAGKYIAIDPKDFYGVQFLKILVGSYETASRSIVCSMKGI